MTQPRFAPAKAFTNVFAALSINFHRPRQLIAICNTNRPTLQAARPTNCCCRLACGQRGNTAKASFSRSSSYSACYLSNLKAGPPSSLWRRTAWQITATVNSPLTLLLELVSFLCFCFPGRARHLYLSIPLPSAGSSLHHCLKLCRSSRERRQHCTCFSSFRSRQTWPTLDLPLASNVHTVEYGSLTSDHLDEARRRCWHLPSVHTQCCFSFRREDWFFLPRFSSPSPYSRYGDRHTMTTRQRPVHLA